MPKELAKASADFADIQKRVAPFLSEMEMLNNNFWNETSGSWGRYFAGLDMLADHLGQIGAASAADPVAANDNEAKELVKGVNEARANAFGISKDYWVIAGRVEGIVRELEALNKQVLGVVKAKSGTFSSSKSVPELQTLSRNVNTFTNGLKVMLTTTGPQKPDNRHFV